MAITVDWYLFCALQLYSTNGSLFDLDLFHAVWKERIDKVSVQNSFTTAASATRRVYECSP